MVELCSFGEKLESSLLQSWIGSDRVSPGLCLDLPRSSLVLLLLLACRCICSGQMGVPDSIFNLCHKARPSPNDNEENEDNCDDNDDNDETQQSKEAGSIGFVDQPHAVGNNSLGWLRLLPCNVHTDLLVRREPRICRSIGKVW